MIDVMAAVPQLAEPLLLGVKWTDPSYLLDQFGQEFFWISLVIVFVECGLFFPFLPGDTLLFAMGLFIASDRLDVFPGPVWVELVVNLALTFTAALLGNICGYEVGRRLGTPLYQHDGRILKRKYLDQTSAFFDKHGNKALVIGRFVPFVRTYITVVAGVTGMQRRRFVQWSAVGAALWVVLITLLGYFLGKSFPSLGDNIDKLMLVILAFSAVPLAWEWWQHRHQRSEDSTSDAGAVDRDTEPMPGSQESATP